VRLNEAPNPSRTKVCLVPGPNKASISMEIVFLAFSAFKCFDANRETNAVKRERAHSRGDDGSDKLKRGEQNARAESPRASRPVFNWTHRTTRLNKRRRKRYLIKTWAMDCDNFSVTSKTHLGGRRRAKKPNVQTNFRLRHPQRATQPCEQGIFSPSVNKDAKDGTQKVA
jgi:hypothetical protein